MNRKHVLVAIIVAAAIVVASASAAIWWYGLPEGRDGLAIVTFSTIAGEETFGCEVADSLSEQAAGLSNRDGLASDEGMIFVFQPADEQVFWMKETLIPLDIIFIWANGTVGRIYEAPTESGVPQDMLTRYYSPGPVKWVVELNMGTCSTSGITVGSQMTVVY